jgi:GINS complex subunit 4
MVNTLRSDPQTSEEEHFKLMLVQTEMERVKYLVRSYVRTRLHKVCPSSFFATLTAGKEG